jgi:4-hydroxythreonine-4-phosphate dehydrogenase
MSYARTSTPSRPGHAKPIAITLGDAAGIGPEIIAKAFRDAPELLAGCFVVGDVALMRRAAAWVQAGGVSLPVARIDEPPAAGPAALRAGAAAGAARGRARARPHQRRGRPAGGRLRGVGGARRAARRGGRLVTAPLHKEALAAAGGRARYPGHTELLQALAAEHAGVPVSAMPVRMMLANDELRTVLVSIHVSLREAIAR